ncbi:MAG TPA: hypothetical protein VFM88_07540 [Vicinamibacteria bacterium]|nr:hypothetical protein [Vicinamibacteria bacterium]
MRLRPSLLPLAGVLFAAAAHAQPIPPEAVPGPLRDWIPWALDGAGERLCPAVGDAAVCLWPGRLALDASETGARFVLEAYADRHLDLPLPGGERRWPAEVRLDGRPAAVLERQGTPVLRIASGGHRVEGRFDWDRLPDSLAVPGAIAIVDLTVAGRPVPFPKREEGGLLLLRQAAGETGEAENLELKVFRRIADGIPMFVETRLVLDVAGRAREVALDSSVVPGSSLVSVSGELPARRDAGGKLRIQVRAGTYAVTLLARVEARAQRIAAPKLLPPWPSQEVWAFAADERLRQVEITGAPGIDASRTDLPEAWRALPAFLIEEGTALAFAETRRGEPEALPDQLRLERTLWLDEGGRAFSVRDAMGGQVGRSTRLGLLSPGELGRVTLSGTGQLVTQDPSDGRPGVEVRQRVLQLEADSRWPRRGRMPAVGWNVGVQSLRARLLLPPGWRFLGALGADNAPGSWLGSWSLYAFFFVILTAFAAHRLFGPRFGALTLVALVLVHGEAGAPRIVWLFLVAALAVHKAAPEGWLRKLARAAWAGGVLVLALTLLPFVVDQVRDGLFPQAAGAAVPADMPFGVLATRDAPAPAAPPQADGERAVVVEEARDKLEALGAPKSAEVARQANILSDHYAKAYQSDPHAVIQTGSGLPTWSWRSYALSWSGPVSKDHTLLLLLLSPGASLLLTLVRVALLLLLALRVVAGFVPSLLLRLPWLGVPALLLAALGATPARAQAADQGLTPSPELLKELRERLTRPPACAPDCVATARLHLAIEGGTLVLAAEVHAGAPGAWPVPGPAASWVPRSVSVDGEAGERALVRSANGFLRARVPAGVHQIEVRGPLPPRDSLTLQFGETPRRASAAAPGWQVDGIREDGSADASVQLSRRLGSTAKARNDGSYEPWLEVTRVLDIGVSWTVETVVRRVSPTGEPVVVKVPLLKGMLVTDPDRQVKDGDVLVTLGRDETEARWAATLKPTEDEKIALQAPEGRPWSEVWIVNCGPVWQCEASGLPPVQRFENGALSPEFRPWPGEKLDLTFRRPKGAEGRTVTVDRASLHVAPGARLEDSTLELSVRASRPGPFSLTLPEDAEVQELKVKGMDRPIRPEGTKLTLALEAGEQAIKLVWRRDGGLRTLHRAPAVALAQPAVNTQVSIQLPEGRWLLLTGGPPWGPAILFWPYLICLLLGAYLISRAPLAPLTFLQWALLGLGLAQLPLPGALIVAGWFLALAWRRDRVLERVELHDLMQLGLLLWTLLAAGFFYLAVHQGLLLVPDMQVAGGGSSETLLRWYRDRVDGALPRPWVLSVPIAVYRLAMLAWSVWLALALLRWLPWAWSSFVSGAAWRRRERPAPAPAPGGGSSS